MVSKEELRYIHKELDEIARSAELVTLNVIVLKNRIKFLEEGTEPDTSEYQKVTTLEK
jgi:hypothetical protein